MRTYETEVERTYFETFEILSEDRDLCDHIFTVEGMSMRVPFGVEVRLAVHPEYHSVKVVKRGTLYNKARVVFTLRESV